jgi:hypothetical protein
LLVITTIGGAAADGAAGFGDVEGVLVQHIEKIVRKVARRFVDLVEEDHGRPAGVVGAPERTLFDEVGLLHCLTAAGRIVRGVEVGDGVEAVEEIFGGRGATDIEGIEMLLNVEEPGEIEGHLGLARPRLAGEEERRAHGEGHVDGVDQIRVRLEGAGRLAVAAEARRQGAAAEGFAALGRAVVGSEQLEGVVGHVFSCSRRSRARRSYQEPFSAS